MEQCGSIADASLAITEIFERAQEAETQRKSLKYQHTGAPQKRGAPVWICFSIGFVEAGRVVCVRYAD